MKPRLRALPLRGDYSEYRFALNNRVIKFKIKDNIPVNLDYYLGKYL